MRIAEGTHDAQEQNEVNYRPDGRDGSVLDSNCYHHEQQGLSREDVAPRTSDDLVQDVIGVLEASLVPSLK